MNYKHTRGEWVVNPPFKNDNKIFISNGENVIAYMAHNPSVNIDEEAEANAKLIASAPKLLEALRQFIHSVEHEGLVSGRVVDAVRHANEVINNATNV